MRMRVKEIGSNVYLSKVVCTLVQARKYNKQHHNENTAIMDSGNNRQHLFNTTAFFPLGYTMQNINITGVSGTQRKQVGIGTAYFTTTLSNSTVYTWCFPNSIYDPHCPVNLLCMNLFHFTSTNVKTGIEVSFVDSRIKMLRGAYVPMPRHPASHLYLVTSLPVTRKHALSHAPSHNATKSSTTHIKSLLYSEACNNIVAYKHTELQPMNTNTALRILNNPLEPHFNIMVKHHMLADMNNVHTIKSTNKADRPDHYWAGRMTSRNVPKKSRRPDSVKLTPGSHIVSDIGEVPIADRHGNKYFVLFKDLCTQYRTVYRMKKKDELARVYQEFLAHNSCSDLVGTITYRTKYLVSDDDVMYVKGEVNRINQSKLICKYTLAPYTHNANPSESEMRRVMEGAVCNLHGSGLPPSFLLDALDCHVEVANRLYTPVYHDPLHRFHTPYQRFHGTKPSINDIARFGCKTFVFIPKDHRSKPESHAWIGWYLGPSKSMRACRVYRPCTHTVYDRYHTLHDSGTVYGDFLGDMYHKRVKADMQQREYYNEEVRDLLHTPHTPTPTNDRTVTDLLRALPWSKQPLPLAARARPLDSTLPPTKRITRAHTTNTTNTTTNTNTTTTTNTTTNTTTTTPNTTTTTDTTPPPTAPNLTPRTQQARSRLHGNSTNTPQGAVQTVIEPPERVRARNLLKGIVPMDKLVAVCEAIDLTVQYMDICNEMSQMHDSNNEPTMHLYAACSDLTSASHLFLIHLCEQTSRRIANSKEPTTLKQIQRLITGKTVEGALIKEAMLEEVMWMITNNKVKPKNKDDIDELYEIDGKWVIKYKKTLEGLLERVRARWVLRGDKQRKYKDFDPTQLYSPVASRAGTATALILAVQCGLLLFAIDVSKAFTASDIDKQGVHMRVPDGLPLPHSDYAPHGTATTWELLTTLYGLRQASSKYYHKFTSVLLAYTDAKGQKYRRSTHDPCVFTKGKLGSKDYITFSVHVDDKFVACTSTDQVDELVQVLHDGGLVANLESMSKVLGYGVKYVKYDPGIPGSGTIEIDHSQYIKDAYTEFAPHFQGKDRSEKSIPMTPANTKAFYAQPEPEFCKARYKLFRSILGKVAHCANFTHPECSVSVSILSQNMMNPSELDVELVFRVLCYLWGTAKQGKAILTYKYNEMFDITLQFTLHPVHLLCDADLGADTKSRRSRTGQACFLFGNLAAWASKKQQSVSLSTAESEYVALSACAKLGIWYQGLIQDMGIELSITHPIVILSDSQSALNIAQHPVGTVSKYSKHIDQRLHWFRELVQDEKLSVRFVKGEENIADIFTKNLPHRKFTQFRDSLLYGDFRDLRTVPSSCISHFLTRDAPLGYSMHFNCSCCDSTSTYLTLAMLSFL